MTPMGYRIRHPVDMPLQGAEQIAHHRRVLDDFQRSRTTTSPRASRDYDADGKWRYAGIHAELRASRAGRELGKKYAGDPYNACRALGIPVTTVDAAWLTATRGRGRDVAGCYRPGEKDILIADNLRPDFAREVLAHELGHRFGHGHDDDKIADVFMRAFMAATPNPMRDRAAAVAAWEQRAIARAVAARR